MKLTILQINDTHGYLEPHAELFWAGAQAEYRTAGFENHCPRQRHPNSKHHGETH